MKRFYLSLLFLTCCFTISCQNEESKSSQGIGKPPIIEYKTLDAPIDECSLAKLLRGYYKNDHFGASGIYAKDNYFYVVFDNTHEIAKISNKLLRNSKLNSLIGDKQGKSNYEGITFDNTSETFFIVEESELKDTIFYPRINQFDKNFNLISTAWSDYAFTEIASNKAFEGIAYVNRNNKDYILGLVEGTGVIAVMERKNNKWTKISEFRIPVHFNDYSDITVFGDRMAVTSQEDAKVWVGKLSSDSWATIDNSIVYDFPKGDKNGNIGLGNLIIYANVEGVSFMDDNTIVTCTDRANEKQPKFHKHKDQAIQIFKLK